MKFDVPEPPDLVPRLRQQLILAQVRVMEVEDARDAVAAQLATAEHQLARAQELADAKLDEAAHLERMHAALRADCDHLRHQQHLAHEALQQARAQLAHAETSWRNEQEVTTGLQLQLVAQNAALRDLAAQRDALLAEAAARDARIEELNRHQHAMHASRSWRWTAWLRALERAFGTKR
ncbi:hypothetical protein [Oleiharenicola sp. Vm1]|uniref:hypothetical protein n=1 Tax=Oleiharenicola sp. Vm1 TaxID=3398393 RepID=UPI0039F5D790